MVLVCHKHKFIFLKTRKTAGTSIEAALQVLIGGSGVEEETDETVSHNGIVGRRLQGKALKREDNSRLRALQSRYKSSYRHSPRHHRRPRVWWYHHKPAAEVKRDLGEGIWNSYHKISVVRNPWDKVVSLWKWQTRNGATKLPFKDFVMRIQRSDDWHIHSINNRRACDSYIQFEDIEGGLRRTLHKMGVKPELRQRVVDALPHYKDSADGEERDPKAYRAFYDLPTQRHVAEVCKREIAFFGYAF